MRQPSLKLVSQWVFCFSAAPTRTTRAGYGPEWAACQETPAPHHPRDISRAAFLPGTAQWLGNTVEQAPSRLNGDHNGLWVSEQDSDAGRGQEWPHSTLGRTMDKRKFMRPLYIFDLDGTLADIEHRLHFIQQEKKDWRSFFSECVNDKPIQSVLQTLHTLRKGRAEIWVWSGRSDEVREQTKQWLYKHGVFHAYWNPMQAPEALMMRKSGDHRDDVVVKGEWLSQIEPPEWKRLTAVFEDRARVVKMWRDAGVPCFQVAPGDF